MNDQETRKRPTDRDVALYFGVETWKEHEIKLAAYAFHNGIIQVSEAQRITGRTWATSKKDLERLVAKGVLTFELGKFIRDSRAFYKLAPLIAIRDTNPAACKDFERHFEQLLATLPPNFEIVDAPDGQ